MSPKANALLRQLGIGSATALVISNMIGTGILTTSGFLAGQLGSAKLVLLIWGVGAVCALAGAFCYSELGVNFPSSGGEYVYLTEAFGPTWGFMTGWISFFAGFSAPIAAAALAFSDYLGHFSTSLRLDSARHVIGSGSWELKLGAAQSFGQRDHRAIHHHQLPGDSPHRASSKCSDVSEDHHYSDVPRYGIRLRPGRLAEFHPSSRAHFGYPDIRPIFREPILHLRFLQRMERGNLCGRGAEESGSHASAIAGLRDGSGCGAFHRAERLVHLCGAARIDERRGSGGSARGPAPFWTRGGRHLQRGHGAVAPSDRERRDHHSVRASTTPWPRTARFSAWPRKWIRAGTPP